MARRSTVRASDADREHVAERLRHAAGEGRLLAEELEERVARALRARTYGELDPLVADLPHPRAPRRRVSPTMLALRIAAALAVLAVLAVVLLMVLFVVFAFAGMWAIWLLAGWWMFGRHGRAGGPPGISWSRRRGYGSRGLYGPRRGLS